MNAPAPKYRVHHYNPKKRGTWLAHFDTEAEAREFAATRYVYSKPSRVEFRDGDGWRFLGERGAL